MIKGGASAISAFFSVCWLDQCVISPPPPTKKKNHKRVHTGTLVTYKTLSACSHSSGCLLPCYCPLAFCCTGVHSCACTHSPPSPHTHTQSLSSKCGRAGLLQLSGGRPGWGPKRLWNLPEGSSSQSGHVSFSLLSHRLQTPSTHHHLSGGVALWCAEP